ncbi:MAG: hypothetical protein ACREOF_11525 [Gemmatimonadales bacterium]
MRAHLPTLAIAVLCSSGCGDGVTDPAPSNVRVSVSTIGVDPDAAYLVYVGETVRTVPSSFVTDLLLAAGTHDVRLDAIAPNCTLQGPASVRVTVALGQLSVVQFRLECRAVTAAVEVVAPTSGRDVDPDGYTVVVDQGSASELTTTVFANGSVTVEGLAPGTHVASLGGLSDNCALTGSGSIEFGVTTGGLTRDTARVAFAVSCQRVTGDVRLSTTTTGENRDPAYWVLFDGVQLLEFDYYYYYYGVPVVLGPNDTRLFEQVPPGNHTYELTDIAPNCVVEGTNPRAVSVSIGAISELAFHVVCT